MTKILVTGASGLLGSNLVNEAVAAGHSVVANSLTHRLELENVDWIPADFKDPSAAAELVEIAKPEWIVHCAGATDVDRCEQSPDWAMLLNRDSAALVAAAARRTGATLVHISTDAVFDGSNGPYREEDLADPINVYGKSKRAGEVAVIDADPQATVIRTNFYGWSRPGRMSLAEWFLSKLRAGEPCTGFTDVWINPVPATQLARYLLLILERSLSGIYHIGCRECISKYEFGLAVAEAFELDTSMIRPGTSGEGELTAQRPGRLCLDVTSAERELGIKMPRLAEGLEEMVELERRGYAARLADMVREPV